MGMSASQTRYLGLTARKNNNEYEAQQLCEQKTMLAMQMDMVALDYTKKVSNRELLFVQMDASANSSKERKLTYDIITNTNPFSGLNMRVVDGTGKVVVPNEPSSNFGQMQQDALTAYNKSLSNKCFTDIATNADGSTSERIFDGQNFMSSYLSAANTDYINNPILDKDGNEVNVDAFKAKIKLLNAPSFNDFWKENNYSFKNTNLFDKERNYTEDNDSAKAKYEAELAKINDMKSVSYVADLNCLDADYLEKKFRSGEWFLEKHDTNIGNVEGNWKSTTWQSESLIADSLDRTDDSQAEAEYTQQSQFFKSQDKILELRMKQLDTEHGAIQTEMESVKKVIDKNVESSFKIFG